MKQLTKVNRLEVVDWTSGAKVGRDYVKWVTDKFYVNYDIQDNGRTLKIFLTEKKYETIR